MALFAGKMFHCCWGPGVRSLQEPHPTEPVAQMEAQALENVVLQGSLNGTHLGGGDQTMQMYGHFETCPL